MGVGKAPLCNPAGIRAVSGDPRHWQAQAIAVKDETSGLGIGQVFILYSSLCFVGHNPPSRVVYQKSLLEMMQAGYLCDLRAIQVLLHADFDAVHTRHGDFVDSELEEAL